MLHRDFSHVDCWIFDLDHTLYPPAMGIFDQIETKMRHYVMRQLGVSEPESDALRRTLWDQYGTTLAGLVAEHGVDPVPFLAEVHDVSLSHMIVDPVLALRINALPGRKIVFTNGPNAYAHRVLKSRGLSDVFDAVYGCEDANFVPKPKAAAFEAIIAKDQLTPESAAMFEDEQRNLSVPHLLGMKTVHVAQTAHDADHIHHHTVDLSQFLDALRRAL